jgi:hypothetical protein
VVSDEKDFNTLHLGTLKTPQGVILETIELTPEMRKLFTALKVDTPKKVVKITT